MGVAGLVVVAPSNAADAYGLMKSALRHDGPVVFVDHKRLFPTAGEVPLAQTFTPIGQAVIRRPGEHVTIATHGYMVRVAGEAADRLAKAGVSCEIVDLRTLAPLDVATVAGSVARTRALVTLEEGQLACGVGTEVAFRVQEQVGAVRIARVGALPAPVSSNPVGSRRDTRRRAGHGRRAPGAGRLGAEAAAPAIGAGRRPYSLLGMLSEPILGFAVAGRRSADHPGTYGAGVRCAPMA
jgi:hypothetical protein